MQSRPAYSVSLT